MNHTKHVWEVFCEGHRVLFAEEVTSQNTDDKLKAVAESDTDADWLHKVCVGQIIAGQPIQTAKLTVHA